MEENSEYPYFDENEFENIIPSIGVERRHVAKDGQTCADFAQRAAENTAETEEESAPETGKASLGVYITELTSRKLDSMELPKDTKGVLVNSVMEDSAAADAGIEEDDIITKIDDVEVTGVQDLKDEIEKHLPGERVTLTIVRDGETQEVRLTLGNTLAK